MLRTLAVSLVPGYADPITGKRWTAVLRAGRWKVRAVVTRHVRDTFGFDVRARRPARL